MSIVSPSATDAVERLLRAAGRHLRELDVTPTSATVREITPVPAPREPVDADDRGADEDAAAALALALESRNLRERAGRFVTEIEDGGAVELAEVTGLVRAFRSYRPFLRDRDRARNDAVHRRLLHAVRVHGGTAAA